MKNKISTINDYNCPECGGVGVLSKCCNVPIIHNNAGFAYCTECYLHVAKSDIKICNSCNGDGLHYVEPTWEPDEDYWKDR